MVCVESCHQAKGDDERWRGNAVVVRHPGWPRPSAGHTPWAIGCCGNRAHVAWRRARLQGPGASSKRPGRERFAVSVSRAATALTAPTDPPRFACPSCEPMTHAPARTTRRGCRTHRYSRNPVVVYAHRGAPCQGGNTSKTDLLQGPHKGTARAVGGDMGSRAACVRARAGPGVLRPRYPRAGARRAAGVRAGRSRARAWRRRAGGYASSCSAKWRCVGGRAKWRCVGARAWRPRTDG